MTSVPRKTRAGAPSPEEVKRDLPSSATPSPKGSSGKFSGMLHKMASMTTLGRKSPKSDDSPIIELSAPPTSTSARPTMLPREDWSPTAVRSITAAQSRSSLATTPAPLVLGSAPPEQTPTEDAAATVYVPPCISPQPGRKLQYLPRPEVLFQQGPKMEDSALGLELGQQQLPAYPDPVGPGHFRMWLAVGQALPVVPGFSSEVLYTESAGLEWVPIVDQEAFKSRAALRPQLGAGQEYLIDSYGFWRFLVGYDFGGHASDIDALLVAVRAKPAARERWLQWGVLDPDGVTIVLNANLPKNVDSQITADGNLCDVDEGFWRLVGNVAHVQPIHCKDMRNRITGSKQAPGLQAASAQSKGKAAAASKAPARTRLLESTRVKVETAHQCSLSALSDDEHDQYVDEQLKGSSNLQAAHVVPSSRTNLVYQQLFIPREGFWGQQHLLTDALSIDGAGNVLMLPRLVHEAFDRRQMVFLPFPSIGWKRPGEARGMYESRHAEIAPFAVRPRGELYLPGPQHLQMVFLSSLKGDVPAVALPEHHRLQMYQVPKSPVPSAAFSYTAASTLSSRMLSPQLRELFGDMTRRRFPDEDLDAAPTERGSEPSILGPDSFVSESSVGSCDGIDDVDSKHAPQAFDCPAVLLPAEASLRSLESGEKTSLIEEWRWNVPSARRRTSPALDPEAFRDSGCVLEGDLEGDVASDIWQSDTDFSNE